MARPKGSKNRIPNLNPDSAYLTPVTTSIESPVISVDIEEPLPMRKLWELCRTYGAVVVDKFNRDEIERALFKAGYEPEPPKIEDIDDYWTFLSRFVGKSQVHAVDKAGDFSAEVFPDGSCKLIKHAAPNRHSRVPGMRYHDEVIQIPNLEHFATLLMMLLNESDRIFNETVAKANQDQAKIDSSEAVFGIPSLHGGDPRIEQMLILCDEFGFTGPHKPSLTDMPLQLAKALGIKAQREDGTNKGWQELASEVVEKGDLESIQRGPMYDRSDKEPALK